SGMRVEGADYVLAVDEPTNAILAIGSRSFHAQLQSLIDKLDRRRPQVLIEMTLVAITMSDSMDLGVELQALDLGDAWDYLVFSNFGLSSIDVATGRRAVLLVSSLVLLLAGILGSLLFDVVQLRVEAWLNPWLDPSGRSYQIVQSLMAFASGGMTGRGPGLGNPGVVPISHSDFIFASIAEETGLPGALGLILLIGFFTMRGLRIALHSDEIYHRYLATGLTAYISLQSILIIGGNLRVLPLTGVTLPFVSYGGSSLVTSFMALMLLSHISHYQRNKSASPFDGKPIFDLSMILMAGLAATALASGWWSLVRGPDLLSRTDNPRRSISDLYVPRGTLLDRDGNTIVETIGYTGNLQRIYRFKGGGPVIGYTHPIYGLAGLEASLDPILRGFEGQPAFDLWSSHLLYGQPPPGLDIQLSIYLGLQSRAESLLAGQNGAVVLINASNGEILAMVSSPNFDPNLLTDTWSTLIQDDNSPLVNRVTQGSYQPGAALGPFLYVAALSEGILPAAPAELSHGVDGQSLDCARQPDDVTTWADVIAAGCPGASASLGLALGSESLLALFHSLGFYAAPNLRMPTAISSEAPVAIAIPEAAAIGQSDLTLSPLQLALAAAVLSNGGQLPAARIALIAGSSTLPALGETTQVFAPFEVNAAALELGRANLPIWQSLGTAINGPNQIVTWYLAGTLPGETGTQLVVVVLLEIDFPTLAEAIGQALLRAAMED
ncbi:MAG: FtsW/RodA/SpoVE family cell cycle protein, partial [Chloroflexi bacterium]|nr:FtsW/RodA/SpoVE family cell cycle protein [Chloroflexota bacterium]